MVLDRSDSVSGSRRSWVSEHDSWRIAWALTGSMTWPLNPDWADAGRGGTDRLEPRPVACGSGGLARAQGGGRSVRGPIPPGKSGWPGYPASSPAPDRTRTGPGPIWRAIAGNARRKAVARQSSAGLCPGCRVAEQGGGRSNAVLCAPSVIGPADSLAWSATAAGADPLSWRRPRTRQSDVRMTSTRGPANRRRACSPRL